jgi:hypothetical protein
MSSIQHVKHYFAQMKIDALVDIEQPSSKRGITRKVCAHCTEQQRAPPDYWGKLTDVKIKAVLQSGMDEAESYLRTRCEFDSELDLTRREQFFDSPCLHFPKMEGFSKYVSEDVDDVGDASGADDGSGGGSDGSGGSGADGGTNGSAPTVRRSGRRDAQSADAMEALFQDAEWTQAPEGVVRTACVQCGAAVNAHGICSQLDQHADDVALPEVPPCNEDEERPPGGDEDTNVGAVVEDLFKKHYVELPEGASFTEQWRAMSELMSDFNAGKINKGLQEHRKWRFVGQKLFDAANRNLGKKRNKRGVWDVVMVHYDAAVALDVEVRVNRRCVRVTIDHE